MINSLQSTSIFGVANNLQNRAAHSGVVNDLRTGNGQELESRHVKQTLADESPRSTQQETNGKDDKPVNEEQPSYDSVARRVEEARIAAEESINEKVVELNSDSQAPVKPLEQEVEKGTRRARVAHQVAARYMLTVQGYSIGDPSHLDKSAGAKVNVQV